jgi:iron(II)-dependent oxidoreductase
LLVSTFRSRQYPAQQTQPPRRANKPSGRECLCCMDRERLPSEEEWEAASRTSQGCVYPWGNEWKEDRCNIEESREGGTTQVDRFVSRANELGIADALGNVLEWTVEQNHSDSDEKVGIRYCVAKGGSWASSRRSCSLYSRFLFEPDFHSNILGFRCVAYC